MKKQNETLVTLAKKYTKLKDRETILIKLLNNDKKLLNNIEDKEGDIELCSTLSIIVGGTLGTSYIAHSLLPLFEAHCVSYAGFVGMLGLGVMVGSKIGSSQYYQNYKAKWTQANIDKLTKKLNTTSIQKEDTAQKLNYELKLDRTK